MSNKHKLVSIFLVILVVTGLVIFLPEIIFGAGSQLLINRVQSEQSQTLNVPYRTNTLTFNYTGGTVMVTSCLDKACSFAIDDAAQIIVVRPDGTQASKDIISDTKDKPAENITNLFQVGTNTITVHLIDRFAPVRGLDKPLYLVESATPLPSPKLSVKTIPLALKYANYPFILHSKDPVNTFTGSFTLNRTDIAIKGRGPAPVFARSYDSSNNLPGPLGTGWMHNYAMQLVSPDATTSDLVLIGPEGRADRFTFNSGNYTAPSGIYMSLVKNANGTYTITQQNQTTWGFDEAGKLLRITDRFGNQSTLGYDSNGYLVSISDPAGRGSLSIVNDGSGKITSITDWMNRVMRYGYDASGRLSTVTDREGKVTTYGYDGTTQRITTIKDANNNTVVTNTYDAQGRVTNQQDAKGLLSEQQTTFAYNTNGDGTKTTVVTYPRTSFESTWSFIEEDTYDTQGRITKKVSKPVSNSANWITHEYSYDANGNRSSFKDGRGNTTSYCYDVDFAGIVISGSRGNLTRQIAPAPTVGGNVVITLNKYDDKNNLIQTVSPKGVTSSTSANCSTNFASSINSTYAINYTYDAAKTKLTAIAKQYNEPSVGLKTAVTKYEYADVANPGLPTKEIAPRGNTGASPDYTYATVFTYFTSGNKAGMLESTSIPSGAVTKFDYDAVGRKIAMINPKGNISGATPSQHTSNYSYDNEDRLRFAKAPAPVAGQAQLVTETRYDAVGNKTAVIDANGQVTKYVYDMRDSLKEVLQSPNTWTDPSVFPTGIIKTTYDYDNFGNLKLIVRATNDESNERLTQYTYDGLNRVMKETQYPNWPSQSPTLVTTYMYDKNGNQTSVVDPLGKTTSYGYDNLNRQIAITYNNVTTPNVTYSYDGNNNRTQMVDGTGTTTYTYDELNRMMSVQSPGPKTLSYRYDLDGNRTKVIYPDNTFVTYTFDKSGQMASHTDWSSRTMSYEYFIDGHLKKTTNVNGTTAENMYDNTGRLTQVWNKDGADTITQHKYQMDALGNRIHTDEVLADGQIYAKPITADRQGTIDYTYDRLSRVTKEDRKMPFPQDVETYNYTYDTVGNRLSETRTYVGVSKTSNFTYDKADRITTATGQIKETYTVDANGNLIKRGDNSLASLQYTQVYDQANRMIQSNNGKYKYTYNGNGDRTLTQELVNSSLVTRNTYIYDVNRDLPVVLQDANNKFVWGLGLAYMVDGGNSPYIYHVDGLGSVRAMTDNRGATNKSFIEMYEEYKAFGVEGYSSGNNTQPFKFTGEEKDEFTNAEYIYLRSRYYDPTIARFTSRDSVMGDIMNPLSLNRYSYTQNNPVNYTDPNGKVVWIPVLIGIGAGVGATLNVIASDDKSFNGVVDAAWKGAVAGGVGTTVAIVGSVGLGAVGVGGITASIVTGAGSGFAGNATLNLLDGADPYENAFPATLGGAIFGPLGDELVTTVGRPATRSWNYIPRRYVGPNTSAVYDREFLSNLYSGIWGYTFQNTKK